MATKYVILFGLVLFACGLVAGRKLPGRWRLAWLVPILIVLGLAASFLFGLREERRQAAALFGRLENGQSLSPAESDLFRALTAAPQRVRERVIKLAFASTNNAAVALPRLGLLLHVCTEIEPVPGLPARVWNEFALPAIRQRPSPEILRLAAGTADFFRLGTNAVQTVASPLLGVLQTEPSASERHSLIEELAPLSDRMSPAQRRMLADAILRALNTEPYGQDYEPLVSALRETLGQFDNEWAQRTISEALASMELRTNQPQTIALAVGLADAGKLMTSAQRSRLAQILAANWLDQQGQVRPRAIGQLTGLVSDLPQEAAELSVRLALKQVEPYSYSIFYQTWGQSLSQFLSRSAAVIGPERTAGIVSAYLKPVREPWSDLLWARFIGALMSGRPAEESRAVARRLLDNALAVAGQPRGWFVERFGAVISQVPPEFARQLGNELIERLAEVTDGAEYDAMVACLVKAATRLEPAGANELAQCLLPLLNSINVATEASRYLSLSRVFESVAGKLDAATTRAAVDSLLVAMSYGRNPYRFSILAERLAPFAPNVDPMLIQSVVNRLVTALETERDLDGMVVLAPGLAALSGHMDAAQGMRVGEILIRALASDPQKVFLQGSAVEELAKQMSADQSKRAVDLMLQRGMSRFGPDLAWAQRAPTLAGSLTPELAAEVVEQLTGRLSRERDPGRLSHYVQVALPFSEELRPEQLDQFADQVLLGLEGNTSHYALERLLLALPHRLDARSNSPRGFIANEESTLDIRSLRTVCRALAVLFSKMNEADASRAAERLAWRFRQQGWFRPLPYDPELANALQYAPTRVLQEILKTPFAVGGLRRTTLEALARKT